MISKGESRVARRFLVTPSASNPCRAARTSGKYNPLIESSEPSVVNANKGGPVITSAICDRLNFLGSAGAWCVVATPPNLGKISPLTRRGQENNPEFPGCNHNLGCPLYPPAGVRSRWCQGFRQNLN